METVHPDNLALAVRAVAALKLDLAAVDFLIPDITRSWTEVGGGICEINAQPQFGDDVPPWLFERMLPGRGRIPVVYLAADAGAPRWAALRKDLAASGTRLGWASAEGACIGPDRVAMTLPHRAFDAASLLLGDDRVDALVVGLDASLAVSGAPVDRGAALLLSDLRPDQMEVARGLVSLNEKVLCDAGTAAWHPLRPVLATVPHEVLSAEDFMARVAVLLRTA
jgi:cyanophycin synthetase